MVVPSPAPVSLIRSARVQSKAELRKALREARRQHVAALPAAVSRLVFNRPPVPVVEVLPAGGTVALYDAVGAEAPASGWAKWLQANGLQIALPWFADRDAPMAFRAWSDPWDGSDLVPAPWGGRQPSTAAEEVVPGLVVVPLVGFTADGHRLGQGGGHYDRWLAANPATPAIGLAWDVQQVAELPLEPHDRKLTAVVTPTRIHWSPQ